MQSVARNTGDPRAALPVMPSFRLDGKRALVTGAGRGIGLAASVALAAQGAAITLVARSEAEIVEAAEGICSRGQVAVASVLDVTDSAQCATFFAREAPFDIVVNSAGMNRPAPLAETDDETIAAIYSLNVLAVYRIIRSATEGMIASSRGGSIISISSQMGHVGAASRSVYCGTKHALEGMTKALAWELGTHRIRINTICPTFIDTRMTSAMLADTAFHKSVVERIALGRVGQVEDVMGAICFLAADASAMVTGSALMVDGGWSAQ